MKTCTTCGESKPSTEFASKHQCLICRRAYLRAYRRKDYRPYMFARMKFRAAKLNVPFDIESADIPLVTHCPVFGFELKAGDGFATLNSPSLDRIIPELGYVKGNIIVISHKANMIKSSATPDEVMQVAEFFKKLSAEVNK